MRKFFKSQLFTYQRTITKEGEDSSMISKKIMSIVVSTMVFCFMVCASVTGVKADDSEVKIIDGSYLTSADSSTGYTPKSDEQWQNI